MPDTTTLILNANGTRQRWRVAGRPTRFMARTRISPGHLVQFFQQMEMLLLSGVLIADALGRLKERYPDKRTRRVLRDVHARVAESRARLSESLALFPRSFPPGIITMIEAGEESGAATLAERFADLADRISYEEANRRQVLKACAYPVLVILMTVGLYLLLLGAVYPRLTELLTSLGGGLPPLTRGVIAASHVASRWWPAVAALVIATPALIAALRRFPSTGVRIDRLFLRLPLVGAIYRDLTVALICKLFCSLYRANKSAPEIVDLCSRLVGNQAFRRGLRQMRDQMTTGGFTVTRAFGESGLFPPLACMAIDVGEQSGQIAKAMDRVAGYFSARARERISASIAIVNPAMTLAVVGGAGLILISFFQALYQVIYATR